MANTCKSYARKQKWVFFSEYSVDHTCPVRPPICNLKKYGWLGKNSVDIRLNTKILRLKFS